MMLLHFHTAAASLFLPLLLFSSSPCTADVRHLINCGSSSTAASTTTGQTFVGEDAVTFSRHRSRVASSADPSELLYKTARVFTKPSTYDFNLAPEFDTYFVRLHFYAFSSLLANAKFNVSASGHMLLSGFSLGNISRNSSTIKEFILRVNQTRSFKIYFFPNPSASAFINAIEVLSTTSNITKSRVRPSVTPAGSMREYKGQNTIALETIYRINVGGREVKSSSDHTLWRTWEEDDTYLINKSDAQNTSKDHLGSTNPDDDAPPAVYETAKTLKASAKITNLTWKFSVKKGTQYFVRVHFCDLLSSSGVLDTFRLYIYRDFSQVIDPLEVELNSPFNKDYVVESDDLEFLNISVGPNNATSENNNFLFLNGVEIMQVKNETASEPRLGNDSHRKLIVLVSLVASASVVALTVVLATILVCLCLRKRRKNRTESFEWGNLPLHGGTSSHNRGSETSSSHATTFQNLQLGLRIPLIEIQRVTNNFDASLIIGEGGFGKVYKGTLKNGIIVAVKRGSLDHGQGVAEFQTEIMILSTIRHRHLVSLIGYCSENGEMILVYEFMAKGTLRYHLYDSKEGTSSSTRGMLTWQQRVQICIEAAKGIQYLHTGTNKGIIHRDVKSTNILLDDNYVAKVADFGLSRSGYLEETHVSVSDVKGTFGYLDPEYAICLQLTEKSDVYAFGVVLFEVLCARPALDPSLPKKQVNLADWAMACYERGQLETIIDPLIAGDIDPNSLKKFCEITERCLKKDASERPPMSDVCWGLEYALQLQKAASERVLLDDTITDVSLNMPLPAVRRFPSQSIADDEYDDELLDTSNTGEVFSQLAFDDGTAR
ncbi:hypothetical protein SOVF_047850 [Spinacia oleracea]|nr:hypothetical protein SOVF_047850 [Spinacia oleracea]